VGGLNERALNYLSDFIKHHMLVGVTSFVFGLHASPDSPVFAQFRRKLRRLLDAGVVQLHATYLPDVSPDDSARDELKMLFYQTCLFHAKVTSEFVGIWDLDEYWTPSAPHELANLSQSLSRAVRSAETSFTGCPTWCWLTFPSFKLSRTNFSRLSASSLPPATGRPALDYKYRVLHHDWTFQKSLIRARQSFHAGFHFPGSCAGPAQAWLEIRLSNTTCAHKASKLGVMRHFFHLTRSDFGPESARMFYLSHDEHRTLFGTTNSGQSRLYQTLDEYSLAVRETGHERLFGKVNEDL
jgi:hypothetical protein